MTSSGCNGRSQPDIWVNSTRDFKKVRNQPGDLLSVQGSDDALNQSRGAGRPLGIPPGS